MKYLLTPAIAGRSTRHQVEVVNQNPTKTQCIRGYGFGVTFSSWCFKWNHTFSSNADFLKFSNPATSA